MNWFPSVESVRRHPLSRMLTAGWLLGVLAVGTGVSGRILVGLVIAAPAETRLPTSWSFLTLFAVLGSVVLAAWWFAVTRAPHVASSGIEAYRSRLNDGLRYVVVLVASLAGSQALTGLAVAADYHLGPGFATLRVRPGGAGTVPWLGDAALVGSVAVVLGTVLAGTLWRGEAVQRARAGNDGR